MHAFRKPLMATAAALALAACGPQPEESPAETPRTEVPAATVEDIARAADGARQRAPGELDSLFAQAAGEFDVPVRLLKAISYAETRWQHVQGAEEHEGRPAAFGLLALRGVKVTEGAALAGVSEEQVRMDPLSNLRAGAALLSRDADALGIDRKDLGAWAPVAVKLTDISNPEAQSAYVHQDVYGVLREGAALTTLDGSVVVSLEAGEVQANFAQPPARALAAGPDYPNSVWHASPNYNARPTGTTGRVQMVVIHTCEGAYSGCWGWLVNSAAGVSAHYVVIESGSEISQLVRESSRAWHVGATYSPSLNGNVLSGLSGVSVNHFSVGIEHGGFASQTSFPAGQLSASARLTCDITRDQGIVRDSYHIVAHGRLQPSSRTDPGPNWPWSSYISQVKSACGDTTPSGTIVVDTNAANNNANEARFELTGTWTAGTSAGYYGSGYYYAATEAVSAPATFWFYLPAAATKTIDAWWVAGTNRSPSAPFIAYNAAGTNLGSVSVNQQANGGQWNALGTWNFTAGWNKVQLSRWTGAGYVVMADAIRVR